MADQLDILNYREMLYREEKYIEASDIKWEKQGEAETLVAPVMRANGERLVLRGWRRRGFGFALLYDRTKPVRIFNCHPHPNPDGELVVGPHKQPRADKHTTKWAYPVNDISMASHHHTVGDIGRANDFLFMRGVDLYSSNARKQILNDILVDSNVSMEDGELLATAANESELPRVIHNLLNSSISLHYLVYQAQPRASRTFRERVRDYLAEKQIGFEPDVSLNGKIREHRFDFVITKEKPVAIRTLSTSTPNYARTLAIEVLYAFTDIRRNNVEFTGVSLVDDEEEQGAVWQGEPLQILTTFSDRVVFWSRRDDLAAIVAA